MSEKVHLEIEVNSTLLKEIDKLVNLSGVSREKILQQALESGLAETKLEIAFNLLKEKKTTVEEASVIAQLEPSEFLSEYRRRNLASIMPDTTIVHPKALFSGQ